MFCNMLPIYLLILAALAAGAIIIHARFSALSLPVPIALRVFAILLPILGGFNTFFTRPSFSSNRRATFSPGGSRLPPNVQMTIYTAANAIQGILTTVLITLFGTFMAPISDPVASCRLSSQWDHFWRTHDDSTISRLQNRFDCCGFRKPQDRAWPFPNRENNHTTQCMELFHRKMPCQEPWGQELRANAGAAVAIFVVVGVLQILSVVYGNSMLRAMGRFWPQRPRDESRGPLLPPVEEADEEVRRDDDSEERRQIGYGGTDVDNGPRVQPSVLGNGHGNGHRGGRGDGERNEWESE